ncbi:hypothetical protein LKV13_03530 [Borrelia sp. BU AG58]|uniref:DUF898 domain-containing protein n=1 Tax=Borrelia sp. BU AG58 TaxID=2887345 RepID=UPI001E3E711C|nr:DUF898 domain-containing protein [Borrelia sp. BU AG58]UER67840.1 hypothetical protein LKV13_03530 [Borrelia sp. BU AG58]
MSSKSYFDGGVCESICVYVGAAVITCFTLGFCFPWAYCMVCKFHVDHTVIEGRRLKFEEDGANLLGHWIIWWVFCVITLGIYALWMGVKVEKWKVEHTRFAD